jgi:transposase, IS5 family
MRSYFPTNYPCQSIPIESVALQLHSRHELIPILAGLQHLYGDEPRRQHILQLIAADINPHTATHRGRPGLSYWEILVLAALRLGGDLDYDAMQDLAENHYTLRLIMGVGEPTQEHGDSRPYLWHRLRDNLCLLRPETLEKINQAIVAAGHELEPQAAEQVRGDTFVMETNIHYPTESSLIGDGIRKILQLGRQVAQENGVPGWRETAAWRKELKKALRRVNQACRSKSKQAEQSKRQAYSALYTLAEKVLVKVQQLEEVVSLSKQGSAAWLGLQKAWRHYVEKTIQVISYSRRRVLQGEKIGAEEKVYSLFEPETEMINRGKQPNPIQFGHRVLVIEDDVGFICDYAILEDGVEEAEMIVGEMKGVQKRLGKRIRSASFDRGFHSGESQKGLKKFIPVVCIPKKGKKQGARQAAEASVAWQQARQKHPGVEALIGVLQRSNGMKRCRDRSRVGYARHVGLGILGRNLHTLGKVVLRRSGESLAGLSKRKRKEESSQ